MSKETDLLANVVNSFIQDNLVDVTVTRLMTTDHYANKLKGKPADQGGSGGSTQSSGSGQSSQQTGQKK